MLSQTVTKPVNMIQPRRQQVVVTELADDGNSMMRLNSKTALTKSCRNGFLLFCLAGFAESKLGMKRSRSEKNGMMFLRKRPKKKKAGKLFVETGADVCTQETKEKDIMDESQPAASSNVSEKQRTAMTRLIKVTAFFCSIYDVDF